MGHPVEPEPQIAYDEYFSTRAVTPWGQRVLRVWHGRMFDAVSSRIPGLRESSILEVGAGWGFFAEICRAQRVEYHGLEMNPRQAAKLREQGFDVAAAAIPPFPAGRPAQVIWMSHVLEHAETYRHAAGMLAAAFARLEPGGHVVIIAPDLHAWKENFWSVDWSHGFPTTVRRVEQILSETGFSVVIKTHHTATVTNPIGRAVLGAAFRLIPVGLLDAAFEKFFGRPFCYSFMGVFGWRQILVVGRKPAAV